MLALIILWHFSESLLYEAKSTTAILNSGWICFSYLNPLLLITLNTTIRRKVIRMLTRAYGHPRQCTFCANKKVPVHNEVTLFNNSHY
ncbi:unnamed protein product [Cylicocyclus nassatus]|uniref:Uncharacterized protein n=1 Tax=Cylicocyclus nassatus TaxID=53992 RepID=A0AA36H443_CYLNA|nr:unnamed protein product [Cylicocyclus nassatus]